MSESEMTRRNFVGAMAAAGAATEAKSGLETLCLFEALAVG